MKNSPYTTRKIICLHGGAGCSKTTTMFGLAYNLKLQGYEVEINAEYIKDWAWEGKFPEDGDQSYVFAKQSRKERLYMRNNMDFIITDSPLILTHFYGMKYDYFEQNHNTSRLLLEQHHSYCKSLQYKVEHFYINRAKPYSESGRYQTEEESKQNDKEIINMLDSLDIHYKVVDGDHDCVDNILEHL